LNGTGVAIPTSAPSVFKAGLEYGCSCLKSKLLVNLRSFLTEHSLSYKARPDLVLGYNLILDPLTQNLDKYEAGLTWSPAENAFVGLRHESLNKKKVELGKILFFLHHNVSPTRTVGSEFGLEWQSSKVSARVGYQEKIDENTTLKLKVNQAGYLDLLLKRQLNSYLNLGLVTGVSAHRVLSEQKTGTLPLGLTFDFKF